MTTKGRGPGIGVTMADRALKRTAQTYCGCGAKKADRKKYCVDCTDARINFNSQNPEAKRRAYIRLAAAQRKGERA